MFKRHLLLMVVGFFAWLALPSTPSAAQQAVTSSRTSNSTTNSKASVPASNVRSSSMSRSVKAPEPPSRGSPGIPKFLPTPNPGTPPKEYENNFKLRTHEVPGKSIPSNGNAGTSEDSSSLNAGNPANPSELNNLPGGRPYGGLTLLEQLLLDRMLNDRQRPNPPLPPLGGGAGPLIPPPVIAPWNRPVAARGAFEVKISKLRAVQETSDDATDGGPGDEIMVRCAVGYYSKSKDLFGVLTTYKTKVLRGLRTRDVIMAPAFPASLCAAELVEGDHIILIAPTLWELDDIKGDDDGLGDRAEMFHELVMVLEEDIGRHVKALSGKANSFGPNKPGQSFGFPFVSGTAGNNRPIGVARGSRGRLEFCPKLIVMDLKEAEQLAKRPAKTLFKDDTSLGGHYELDIEVVPLR